MTLSSEPIEVIPPQKTKSTGQTTTSTERPQSGHGSGRPITIAIAASLVMLTGWLIYSRGFERYREMASFNAPVKQDTSEIKIKGAAPDAGAHPLRPGEIALAIKDPAGRIIRVAAQRGALEAYQKEVLFFLKRREVDDIAAFKSDVKAAFDNAFSDGDERLNEYADWFFEWKRSWILMKEAVVAGGSEITNIFSPSKIWDAVKMRLQTYLMENYTERVLRPQSRDPVIRKTLNHAFRAAHERFINTTNELQSRERQFIASKTRFLEALPADAVAIKLDWNSQKWRIPAHLAEDRAEDAYRSVAVMGGAIALGPLLQPVLRRVGQRIMARVAGRVAVANGGKIFGAYLGVETFGASLLIGAVTDYALNLIDERLSRENFITEHRAALTETRKGWEHLAVTQLSPVVQRWYGDTQQAFVRSEEGEK